MSEWFKEHDWKSCDGGDSSGGSNPLLCARGANLVSLFFIVDREELKLCRFPSFVPVHDVGIYVQSHVSRAVSYKLLADLQIHAAFRAPCNEGMPKVMKMMRGAKPFEIPRDRFRNEREDALFRYRYSFPLFLQNLLHGVRAVDIAEALFRLRALYQNKPLVFIDVTPSKRKRFVASNARAEVKQHEPLIPRALCPF